MIQAGILLNQLTEALKPNNQPNQPKEIKLIKRFKYPFISSEDFKNTMNNLMDYINNYNSDCKLKNKKVQDYNQLVVSQNLVSKVKKEAEKKALKDFNSEFNAYFVLDYNKEIDQHNQTETIKLKKRTYKTIKWNSTLYFKAILGFYVSQIKRNNLRRLKANIKEPRKLEKVRINSYELANCKTNSQLLNLAHSKTFQRHVKRFREAGILIDYQFISPNKPIYAHINPQILAISDDKNQKIQKPQNQSFISKQGTKCSLFNHTTRTILNEIKMKADESAELPTDTTNQNNSDFYKNPRGIKTQEAAKELPQKNIEGVVINEIHEKSAELRESIQDNLQFAKDLTNNVYEFYTPISEKDIFNEMKYGLLDKSEFRTLVIQDLIKRMAKLWRKSANVHVGSWVNALKIIDDNWFMTFNGYEFDKITIFNQLQEYHYRIKRAKEWFTKNKNFNILYPSIYFDPTKTHSTEGGFAFTRQWWNSYKSTKPKAAQQKRLAKTKHKKHVAYQNQLKRMRTRVKQVIDNKITLQQLFEYLDTNKFPEEIIDLVPETIKAYEKL